MIDRKPFRLSALLLVVGFILYVIRVVARAQVWPIRRSVRLANDMLHAGGSADRPTRPVGPPFSGGWARSRALTAMLARPEGFEPPTF